MKTDKQIVREMESEVTDRLKNLSEFRDKIHNLFSDKLKSKLTLKAEEGLKATLEKLDVEIISLMELSQKFKVIKSK